MRIRQEYPGKSLRLFLKEHARCRAGRWGKWEKIHKAVFTDKPVTYSKAGVTALSEHLKFQSWSRGSSASPCLPSLPALQPSQCCFLVCQQQATHGNANLL